MRRLTWNVRRLAIFAIFFLVGCGSIFPNINPPKTPDTVYSYDQSMSKVPSAVIVEGGKIAVVESQEQRVSINLSKKEKPLSLWQRFCNWLGNLGFISIIALAAGMILAPAGTLTFLTNWYMKFRKAVDEHRRTKKALAQTVKAIDAANALEATPGLRAALSSEHDQETKILIDDIKRAV